jgi:phenylpyruvate tautomerase PptA (4-oxalocrotonate tautomerase family)
MPLVKIQSTKEVTDEVLQSVSDIISDITGKPGWAIMITAEGAGSVCMNREVGEGAFIDVRGVGGLEQSNNAEISKQVSSLLSEKLNINSGRIYFNFTNYDGSFWGHGGVEGRNPGTF